MQQTEAIAFERRLVATKLSEKPNKNSFFVTAMTVATMAFATVFYWRNPLGWSTFLPAVQDKIFLEGEWWRLFTAILIHSDLQHFLSNMFMLWIFTFFIYGHFGFKIFPLTSVVVAALVNAITIMTYHPYTRLLGASGLVYVLGGVWLTLFFLIQRQYSLVSRCLRTAGIAIMIFWPTTFEPTTSYRTHAIGFVAGVLLAVVYFYKNRESIRQSEVYQTFAD